MEGNGPAHKTGPTPLAPDANERPRFGDASDSAAELPDFRQSLICRSERRISRRKSDAKDLVPFAKLSELDLSRTFVSDAGLKELAKLTELTSLDLRGTRVTKGGVRELRKSLLLTNIIFGP
jgi:hypothetical protein